MVFLSNLLAKGIARVTNAAGTSPRRAYIVSVPINSGNGVRRMADLLDLIERAKEAEAASPHLL